jgi:hypothetical protein
LEPDKLVASLDRELVRTKPKLIRLDEYYEGEQPLRYMAPALQAEVGDRIAQLVVNWPRLGADSYENRLDIEGFRYAKQSSGDEVLWDMWQENDGDEQSQQGHLESLILGRSYVIVGAGEDRDDVPVMTVEHPLQVIARHDPKTRRVTSAVKRWKDEDNVQWAQLYLPDATITYRKKNGWIESERDDHQLGRVPVVPLVNRGRMLRQLGVSEFRDIIPVADAANKMATDMMISGEFHAMPRRWMVGLTMDDFQQENGSPASTWSMIAGRIWGTDKKPDDVEMGQFVESDLAVFHSTIRVLAQLAAQLLALPPHYMSFTTDNPASADAIRSSETQLVKRAERKQTTLGGGWEEVQRLMLRFLTGTWDRDARSLETIWRDPSTPTVAQKADAIVKLTGGKPILPVEQAREDLGYTPEQRKRMAEMDEEEARRSLAGLGELGVGVKPEIPVG